MDTPTKPSKMHLQLVVSTHRLPGTDIRNFCNATRADFQLEAAGFMPVTPVDAAGQAEKVTCPTCTRKLEELGYSLDAFARAHRTTAQVQAEQQAFAKRRQVWQEESFAGDIATIAKRLRAQADDLEREFARYQARTNPTPGDATNLATRVLHGVLWMTPNLNLDGLLSRAAELDVVARLAAGPQEVL